MTARYLPPDLYRRIGQVLPPGLPPEQRAPIVDLVEAAFGWGYMEGHDRGTEETAWAATPLVDGRDQRVGTVHVRTNGYAPHPSAQGHPVGQAPAHRLDPSREPGTVTPLRMGQIGEIDRDIALDRLDTDQVTHVTQAEAARLGHE